MSIAADDPSPASAQRTPHVGGTPTAHAVLDVLVGWGVRRIYCCPGSTEAVVLDALATRADIHLVLVTHESVAVAMAEGEARVTHRPAVAYVHTHVGMANALAHLSSAQLAYAPVVLLNGLKASTLAGRLAFTSADPREMVRQHVKWAHIVANAAQLPCDVDRALHVAVTEPAGPVWLGLHQDLLESQAPAAAMTPSHRDDGSPVRASLPAIEAAARLLAEAAHPALVVGADLVRRSAVDELVKLAERLGAPIFEEGRRDFVTSVIATDHPLRSGRTDQGADPLRHADVVAYLGCRMFTEFEAPGSPGPAPQARTIHLHSDPREVGRLHRVDVSLVGDPAQVLSELLVAVPPGRARGPVAVVPPEARSVSEANSTSRRPPGHDGLGPVVASLADAVQATDATVVLDATTATAPLLDGLLISRPGQVLGSTSGSLGWGMGAALGVAVADPRTPVVCVVGDGAFQFGLPALWVARRLDAPVTFLVLDNGLYAAVASALDRFDGEAPARGVWPGTEISGLDIAAAAEAFGLAARRLHARDEGLAKALLGAVQAPGPAVVVVDTKAVSVG